MKNRAFACSLFIPAAALCAVSAQAQDDKPPFSGTLVITSDYLFRGISQTNREPALQGSIQYDHSSGFYAGVWASSISWLSDLEGVSSNVEFDGYAGFKGAFAESWSFDVGVLRYQYPGEYPEGFTSPNTTEVYGSIGWTTLSAKYSYGVTDIFGFADSESSDYLELNWNQPFAEIWTLNAHVGHQTVDGFSDADYTDYRIGVTVGLPNAFSLAGAYSDTNADKGVYTNPFGRFLGKQTGVLTLTRAF